MEEFRKSTLRIQTMTNEHLEEEYHNLVNYYKKQFINIIIDLVDEKSKTIPCSIPEYQIESWIEEYLLSELYTTGRREIQKVTQKLDQALDSLDRYLNSPNMKFDQASKSYEEILAHLTSEISSSWIQEIIYEFNQRFARKVEYYFIDFIGLSEERFYHNLDELKQEMHGVLNRKGESFYDEFKDVIKSCFRKNQQQMEEKLSELEQRNKKIKEEEHQNLETIMNNREIMMIAGFEIIEENNKFYAREKSTSIVHPIRINKGAIHIEDSYSKDGRELAFTTEIQLDFESEKRQSTCVDIDRNICFLVKEGSFVMTPIDRSFTYQIVKNDEGYLFLDGDRELSNEEEIKSIIDKLKEYSPYYYEKLLKDPAFAKLVSPAQEQTEGLTSLFMKSNAEESLKETIDESYDTPKRVGR